MREIAISKFKASCLTVLEDVRRTGAPIRITRFGCPVADLVPPKRPKRKSWLGCMKGTLEISGDIVGPIGDIDDGNSLPNSRRSLASKGDPPTRR